MFTIKWATTKRIGRNLPRAVRSAPHTYGGVTNSVRQGSREEEQELYYQCRYAIVREANLECERIRRASPFFLCETRGGGFLNSELSGGGERGEQLKKKGGGGKADSPGSISLKKRKARMRNSIDELKTKISMVIC